MRDAYDVVVIGAGPGGYVAAIRCAQLGLKTACVERENLGGICLNWGCIPTKALLRSAEVLETFHRAKEFGIIAGEVRPDFSAMIQRSRGIADKVSKGVGFLFKKNKIAHIAGTATLLPRSAGGKHQIQVDASTGRSVIEAKHVILATGARAKPLPGIPFDGERIIEYRKAMTLPEQPASMIVLGAGAIGVEFASFYRSLGTQVTIVEFLPRLVPNEDPDISKELARAFDRKGIQLFVGHKLTSAKISGNQVVVTVEPAERSGPEAGPPGSMTRGGGESRSLEADILLVAVGVAPNVEDLGLSAHGVALERGFIKVDAENRCGDGLWAIGDVTGRGLAHVASAEGVFVAEKIAGMHAPEIHYDAIPACTYCHPEIASVGLTEEKARAQNIPVKVGKMPFRALAKATAAGDPTGFVKVLWHAETGALVGAHMIGPAVTDLIAEYTLAKTTEVNAESLAYTVHAHPTFAEALRTATEDALGHAIDL
ncbi:MAG TPA: dihydrolipoyl dehydrogenase [Kofleriaceae bacterium]|jgi:dihydrolipoamide dehydrogenase|nr:dihydrolipoyl dehydrogenase [Kofleriaceae bacterium]